MVHLEPSWVVERSLVAHTSDEPYHAALTWREANSTAERVVWESAETYRTRTAAVERAMTALRELCALHVRALLSVTPEEALGMPPKSPCHPMRKLRLGQQSYGMDDGSVIISRWLVCDWCEAIALPEEP